MDEMDVLLTGSYSPSILIYLKQLLDVRVWIALGIIICCEVVACAHVIYSGVELVVPKNCMLPIPSGSERLSMAVWQW